jgi:hypothetical protein
MDAIELVKTLEQCLNIPRNRHIILVFENNDSEDVIGYIVAEKGKEGDYPILTAKELIDIYS